MLQKIHEANPLFGPVYLSTLDIANEFYQIGLRLNNAILLGVLFPSRPGKQQLIAVPLVLQMGWKESPPAFCAATETVANLANNLMTTQWQTTSAPHRLNSIAETRIPTAAHPSTSISSPPMPCPLSPPRWTDNYAQKPLKHWDIYVDNFLGATQGNHLCKSASNGIF